MPYASTGGGEMYVRFPILHPHSGEYLLSCTVFIDNQLPARPSRQHVSRSNVQISGIQFAAAAVLTTDRPDRSPRALVRRHVQRHLSLSGFLQKFKPPHLAGCKRPRAEGSNSGDCAWGFVAGKKSGGRGYEGPGRKVWGVVETPSRPFLLRLSLYFLPLLL